MFISPYEDRWFYTTQADHSGLVGQVAAFWGNEAFAAPKPLRSMIIAAAEHDHIWVKEDHQGLLNTEGEPYDFAHLPYDRHTGLYAAGARQIASHDPYAGLMVSLHGMGIYNYRHGTDDTMIRPRHTIEDVSVIDAYMAGEERFQAELKSQLAATSAEWLEHEVFWTNYHLLQVWDRLGILMSKYQQDDFVIEPAPTDYEGGKTTLGFKSLGPCRFQVTPFPFPESEVTFSFVARWLDQNSFTDDESYRRALDLAPRVPVTYTFVA